MFKKIIFSILFVLFALGLAEEQVLGAHLAAYWDGNYGTAWAGDGAGTRDALEAAGYDILDADQLKAWMDAHIPNGKGSVVVFCRDAVPDTVAETMSDTCTLRRYLDAGGKIVWQADIPFYYMTTAGGANTTWGDAGAPAILGFNTSSVTRDVGGSNITEEGIEWGITESWGSQRAADPDLVDIVLATDNNGNAAAWVKFYVPGDTGGGFVRIRDTGGQANVEDIMRVAEYGLGRNPYAQGPDPKDGAMVADTWTSMSWLPGDFAVSHDVYVDDNFDDVNEATRDSEAFRGNQGLGMEYYIAGFTGYAFPDGLVPGTTYYWRIDEVNDANAASPWKGNVWSFWIPPKKAYEPVPSNGAKFVDLDQVLSWTAGFGAKLHTLYFGDDYDTVANATSGSSLVNTNFNPGELEPEKTYYWRVDEFEVPITHTGDVWSFTTAKVGGGLQAEYYHWSGDFPPANPFQVLVTTEIVPEIDWNWGDPGSPNPLVNDDDFGCRFTGEIEAAFTETYTFYMTTDDGQRLWIDGQPIIDMWVQQGMTEHQGTIDLVAGQRYSIEAWMYEHGGGAGCEMRWSSPSTPKQIIPQAALSPPVRAMGPSPINGATGTKMTPTLKWNPGIHATSHEVYFGTDANAVANADKSSAEYKGSKALGDESYDPGKLAWFTTYYWRVDEVNDLNPDSPWIGNLWSFTTGDFIVVDDFEDYDVDKPIWEYWFDGLGFGTPGSPDFNPGNGTGAAVGDESSPSYMEETIVHSGSKSMPVAYDNNKQGFAMYSETELTLTAPRDWTDEQVAELSIWFRGYPASTGSFVEGPVGTYTMTASGADIWAVNGVEADEFHFAYKMLTGAGSIIARVDSVENTNDWAKAGVMIRETLDPDSAHAFACVTPASGVAAQARPSTGGTSINTNETGITAPHWVKLERSISGLFTVSHSTNGSTWVPVTDATPQNIQMGTNVYIGLALTSHDAALTCQAVFSNVTTSGNVTGQWMNQDIGIESNDAEPLYVAVSNTFGAPAIVVNDDPAAATIDTWTEWVIPLQAFADQGIVLTDVDRIAIGLGTRGNVTAPGGSGKMFFDDIRLYRMREAAE